MLDVTRCDLDVLRQFYDYPVVTAFLKPRFSFQVIFRAGGDAWWILKHPRCKHRPANRSSDPFDAVKRKGRDANEVQSALCFRVRRVANGADGTKGRRMIWLCGVQNDSPMRGFGNCFNDRGDALSQCLVRSRALKRLHQRYKTAENARSSNDRDATGLLPLDANGIAELDGTAFGK